MGKYADKLSVKIVEILEVKRTNTVLLVENRYGKQFKCRLTNKRTIIGHKDCGILTIDGHDYHKSKPIYNYEPYLDHEIEINKVYWIKGRFYADKTNKHGYYFQGSEIKFAPRLTKWLNQHGTFLNVMKKPNYKNDDTKILLNEILLNAINQIGDDENRTKREVLKTIKYLIKQLKNDGWDLDAEYKFDKSLNSTLYYAHSTIFESVCHRCNFNVDDDFDYVHDYDYDRDYDFDYDSYFDFHVNIDMHSRRYTPYIPGPLTNLYFDSKETLQKLKCDM